MKRYLLSLLLASFTMWLIAAPTIRIRRNVTLDDGRTVMVTAYGDEDFDYLKTDDGEVVIETDGVFHATGLTVEEYLATLPQMPRSARREVGSLKDALLQPYGTKKIPVILAAFNDKKFTVEKTNEKVRSFYNQLFNGNDIYASTGNWGSVRKYFIDQSQGQFQPEFSIIGPVTLDKNYAYYGGDYSSGSKDSCYSKFIMESFTKAQAWSANSLEGDWIQFDNDSDGSVDMCVVIFAGMGQNYTNNYGDKSTIWPKELPTAYNINGIKLAGCSSSCEMRPTAASSDGVITNWQADGIGVIVHEISHAIGLPDLYDTKDKAFGLDFWSVMDYGMYTRNSKCPVGYTAYEREFMEWQLTETVNSPRTLHIAPFSKGGKGYKIVNDANPNEYYILDNRQALDWDWGMCSNRGHGMIVLHVDFKQSIWSLNNVNSNPNHQYLTIIPANNSLIGSNNYTTQDQWKASLQGNPYPGTSKNHELTNTTTPASLVFTGTYMSKPLMDIQETKDGIITVKVMPLGTLESPTGLTFEDVSARKATAIWEEVEEAELYNLQLLCEGEVVLSKDSIAGNSFLLEDLRPNVDYTYKVQAISDSYLNSDWAESGSFRDIVDVISEMTTSTELVRIYDMNGRFVGECFADELQRFSLKRGIYIVRRMNGRTKKIMK